MTRWAIYLDLEGTSSIYRTDEAQFFKSMHSLMDGICRIGSRACATSPKRLSVHQTGGDGFILVSEFAEQSPELPIAIAVVLMQTVLAAGGVCKAGISQGEFADVHSCFQLPEWPECYLRDDGRIQLGGGIMTVFPVMGDGHSLMPTGSPAEDREVPGSPWTGR